MTTHPPSAAVIAATLARVAAAFGLRAEHLLDQNRRATVAQARCAAALVLYRQYPQLSCRTIGAALGGRSRETIREAIARAEDEARTDPAFAATLHTLLAERVSG